MTFAPGWLLPTFLCLAPIALLISSISKRRDDSRSHLNRWQILLCVTLAVIPVLILYGVSLATPIHIFAQRYRLVSVTGIALCWALILARFRFRTMRLLFCLSLVAISSLTRLNSPSSRQHEVPWKHAMEFVEQNASVDNAPVLICSAYIESDFTTMPLDGAKTSPLFAPLSYYRLSVSRRCALAKRPERRSYQGRIKLPRASAAKARTFSGRGTLATLQDSRVA